MLWPLGRLAVFQPPVQQCRAQPTAFSIDGHRKPVYTAMLIPRGLVGRLSTVQGCRALVLLHDDHGHPLLATTHRGDQHLTIGLPSLVMRYEQVARAVAVKRLIVDREGMAAELLASLAASLANRCLGLTGRPVWRAGVVQRCRHLCPLACFPAREGRARGGPCFYCPSSARPSG